MFWYFVYYRWWDVACPCHLLKGSVYALVIIILIILYIRNNRYKL